MSATRWAVAGLAEMIEDDNGEWVAHWEYLAVEKEAARLTDVARLTRMQSDQAVRVADEANAEAKRLGAEVEALKARVPNPKDLRAALHMLTLGDEDWPKLPAETQNFYNTVSPRLRAALEANPQEPLVSSDSANPDETSPSTVLNHQDSERVARLLDDPPEPNEALRDLMLPNAEGDEQ